MAVDIKQSTANPLARDPGNIGVQKRVVSKTVQFALFTTNDNAVWAGRRHLLKASYPFAMISFPANRNMFKYEVGDVFKWSYAPYGISNMICRVLLKEEESLESEKIIIHAMEDIFSVAKAVTTYSIPVSHTQPAVDYTIGPFDHQKIIENPYVMSEDLGIVPMACRETDGTLGFEIYMSVDGGISYFYIDGAANIKPFGVLVNAYPDTTWTIDDEIGITVDFHNNDVDQIETITWGEVFCGERNVALLENEIISFQSVTPVSGLRYKLDGIIRGRFGSKKVSHGVGAELYCIDFNSTIIIHQEILAGAARKFKLLPYNIQQVCDISLASFISLSIEGEAKKPYIPINFEANGSSAFARYVHDIVLTWSPRYRGRGAGIGIPGTILSDSDREGYFSVEIWVGGVKKRAVIGIDAVTWTYTEDMNLADNGGLPSSVTFKLSNYRSESGVLYESDQIEVTCLKSIGGLS